MQKTARREVVHFNDIKDVLAECRREGSAFSGAQAVTSSGKLPKHITLLAGPDKLGFYDSVRQEAHIHKEASFAE